MVVDLIRLPTDFFAHISGEREELGYRDDNTSQWDARVIRIGDTGDELLVKST